LYTTLTIHACQVQIQLWPGRQALWIAYLYILGDLPYTFIDQRK
jgi:hypothetical protein